MLRKLTDYRGIVGDAKIAEIYRKGRKLYKKHIVNLSSTTYGGGVAEILRGIIPLMNDIGILVGWRTIVGSPDFFRVTKKFHNALHGDSITLTQKKIKVYEETNEAFSKLTHLDHDLVIVHDPQPLPIIKYYRKRQPWVWRCHIDLSKPNRKLWNYLKGFVLRYDLVVYQMEEFAAHGVPGEYRIINPSVDPLSMKNMPLSSSTIRKYLQKAGVDTRRPLISQISRFDKWKDQLGVLKVFAKIREEMDCQLILIGDIALDDPEGPMMYEQLVSDAKGMKDVRVIVGAHDIMVNAVQRASDVVLQKSIREGFGLSVTESMWKGTPVVASNIGGIPAQIVDGENGYLVDPSDYDRIAEKVMDILNDKTLREKMSVNAREHVRENFLITRQIEDWLDIWTELLL
jgi:trehalose synthase